MVALSSVSLQRCQKACTYHAGLSVFNLIKQLVTRLGKKYMLIVNDILFLCVIILSTLTMKFLAKIDYTLPRNLLSHILQVISSQPALNNLPALFDLICLAQQGYILAYNPASGGTLQPTSLHS